MKKKLAVKSLVQTEPKWKKAQNSKKYFAKWLRWGIRAVSFCLVIWCAWLVISNLRQSVWDGKHRLNLVLVSSSVALLSYDSTSQMAWLVRVPDETLIEVSYGYGQYQARAVAGLDRQEKKKGELIRDSFGQHFGVIIDGQIVKMQNADLTPIGWRGFGLVGNLLLGKLVGKQETNLSIWDLTRLGKALLGLRGNRWEEIDLSDTDAVNRTFLPDGTLVYETDLVRLSSYSQRWLADEALTQENLEVVVVNTTGQVGLGTTLARVLSTQGMHVVEVRDSGDKLQKSEIRVESKNLQKSYTVEKLKRFLRVKPVVSRSELEGRGNIGVFLGEDYQERMKGKGSSYPISKK